MPTWIVVVTWASRSVLLLLALLSIGSLSVMIDRSRAFKKANRDDLQLKDLKGWIISKDQSSLANWANTHEGVRAHLIRAMLSVPSQSDAIQFAVKSFLADQRMILSRGLPVLATLGSNAPFIGLFGTVLGIIQAFGALAQQQSAMQSVMSAISEALVATAVGLFVAIPAVMAYNVYFQKLRTLTMECESLRDLYLAHLTSASGPRKQDV
ncbi:MAG: MotA/TolQ/ExbB proton channel family protein [Methylotenera sp.]|nr:MotA/TolQ/ExbB proton channel family protein [Oligoflexia bacterium]